MRLLISNSRASLSLTMHIHKNNLFLNCNLDLLTSLSGELMIVVANLSYSFDGNRTRKEHWQFPLEAIRELLLNAIVHRDYKNASDIVIKIFDDRIIFTNPGKIFGNQTIQDLERNDYISSLRNKLLPEAFYLTGDIEKYG